MSVRHHAAYFSQSDMFRSALSESETASSIHHNDAAHQIQRARYLLLPSSGMELSISADLHIVSDMTDLRTLLKTTPLKSAFDIH